MSSLIGRSYSSPDTVGSGSARKRVARACVQCRLKKAKCNGNYPCQRCREDDRPCSFAVQSKLRKKERPKGYTELLETDYMRIVAGLRESHRRLSKAGAWPGPPLPERNGIVAVHDILEALGIDDISCNEVDEGAGVLLPCMRCRPNLFSAEEELETSTEAEMSDLQTVSPRTADGQDTINLSISDEKDQIIQTVQEIDPLTYDLGPLPQTVIGLTGQGDASSWLDFAPDYALSSWTPGFSTLQAIQQPAWSTMDEGNLQ